VGTGRFRLTPSIQLRVVTLAGRGGGLASSLPASAANAGIAVGSVAGGVTVDVVGVRAVTLTGLAIAVAAVLVAVLTRSLQPPATDDAQTQPEGELVAP
jgi:MFS transporter, DHA1 family, inner membrane transport protein